MKYISLGRQCSIAYNIKKYINNNQPTNFFDWSRTDFKCVLNILSIKNIRYIFNENNLVIDKELYKHDNEISITLKNFNELNLCLLYHHDIMLCDYSDIEMKEKIEDFIKKYERRHNRLMESIKNEKICFIYNITDKFDYNDIEIFDKTLKTINKNVDYNLVLLVEQEHNNERYLFGENYLQINLHHLKNNNEPDWTQKQYEWKDIFDLINKLLVH